MHFCTFGLHHGAWKSHETLCFPCSFRDSAISGKVGIRFTRARVFRFRVCAGMQNLALASANFPFSGIRRITKRVDRTLGWASGGEYVTTQFAPDCTFLTRKVQSADCSFSGIRRIPEAPDCNSLTRKCNPRTLHFRNPQDHETRQGT